MDSAQAVTAKVESTMRALMPFSPCSRDAVAQIVNLSERSLQRKLAEAGTTFQSLRDRVRVDIALKYLRQSSLQASQIADIQVYSELSAFTPAFKRQHGVSPRQARGSTSAGCSRLPPHLISSSAKPPPRPRTTRRRRD